MTLDGREVAAYGEFDAGQRKDGPYNNDWHAIKAEQEAGRMAWPRFGNASRSARQSQHGIGKTLADSSHDAGRAHVVKIEVGCALLENLQLAFAEDFGVELIC